MVMNCLPLKTIYRMMTTPGEKQEFGAFWMHESMNEWREN